MKTTYRFADLETIAKLFEERATEATKLASRDNCKVEDRKMLRREAGTWAAAADILRHSEVRVFGPAQEQEL